MFLPNWGGNVVLLTQLYWPIVHPALQESKKRDMPDLTPQQYAILNALVTFAAEHIPDGLSDDAREVAKIVGEWALHPPEWPKYRMVVSGKAAWLPIKQAGIVYDSGWRPVYIGGQVMEADSTVRDITNAERTQISDIAEDWSASK